MDTWATLDFIRRGCLEPDVHGRRDGVVYQYVRAVTDHHLPVATSMQGNGYVLTGRMLSADHVVLSPDRPVDAW
jgi:hypothetical protein